MKGFWLWLIVVPRAGARLTRLAAAVAVLGLALVAASHFGVPGAVALLEALAQVLSGL